VVGLATVPAGMLPVLMRSPVPVAASNE